MRTIRFEKGRFQFYGYLTSFICGNACLAIVQDMQGQHSQDGLYEECRLYYSTIFDPSVIVK